MNVILDPGHGGLDDKGRYVTAPNKMFVHANGEPAYEGVLNRQICRHIAAYIEADPQLNLIYTVHPDDPRDKSLSYRVLVANRHNPKNSIFVSVHCNASGNHLGTGMEIFTSVGTTKSDKLADCIGKELSKVYENVNMRLRFDFSDGDLDKEADFYVLRKTYGPAVLIEYGFFDNRYDYDKLKDPYFQGEIARETYRGIKKYVNGIN